MHVLDIAQNSVKANAKRLTITFCIDVRNWLTIVFEDDGTGMSPELLEKVTDPFTTTRTTRKVGLGIPLLKENAQLTGGDVMINSKQGVGTKLTVTFDLNHIDCPPMGAICDTLITLVLLNPDTPEFVFHASRQTLEASFDTRVLRKALDGVALNEPEVSQWIRESINEEFKPILEV